MAETITTPTGDGHSVTITYQDDGSGIWRYDDGTVISRDPHGRMLQMVDAQGWTYTSFDTTNRAMFASKDGQTASIKYLPDGSEMWTFDDGT